MVKKMNIKKIKKFQIVLSVFILISLIGSIIFRLSFRKVFNDYYFEDQWYLKNINYMNSLKFIDKNEMQKVKVALIDGPVDMDSNDLTKSDITVKYIPRNLVNKKFDTGHATHLCSIMIANSNNKEGITGLIHGAKVFSYVITDGKNSAKSNDVIDAINAAINDKVDVINLSFGSYRYSKQEEDLINKALNNNIVVVASYGNHGEKRGMYPAVYAGVISVGAVDKDNDLTIFSNYGESLSVVAPGYEIMGVTGKMKYEKISGTSQATAIVSSLAAAIKSKDRSLSPIEVKSIIENSCKKIDKGSNQQYYGHGLIDYEKALKSIT